MDSGESSKVRRPSRMFVIALVVVGACFLFGLGAILVTMPRSPEEQPAHIPENEPTSMLATESTAPTNTPILITRVPKPSTKPATSSLPPNLEIVQNWTGDEWLYTGDGPTSMAACEEFAAIMKDLCGVDMPWYHWSGLLDVWAGNLRTGQRGQRARNTIAIQWSMS